MIAEKEKTIEKIIEYFKNNENVFNDCMEALDWYNGYLGDDRYYEMEMLNEFYAGADPLEILTRAYYGRDDDAWHTDAHGRREYGEFNPNREYFYFNGYGNLISSDYKDYSGLLDKYVIESMLENKYYIDPINDDDELSALFDEMEAAENEI